MSDVRDIVLCTQTNPAMYISQIHGVNYVSWVYEADREYALKFPYKKRDEWGEAMAKLTGLDLYAVHLSDPLDKSLNEYFA